MKINGWDIADADARQWNVTPGFHGLKNESEWVPGSQIPALSPNEIGFKRISVRILVKTDGGRLAILGRCSEILSRLISPAELELDGFDHKFYGILADSPKHEEKSMERWHALTLTFDCYEYGDEIQVPAAQMTDPITVQNPGNILTPAIIEVKPEIDIISVTLTGLCRDVRTGEDLPVVIRDLKKGTAITLDGETGLFTEGVAQKARDIDIWGLPVLAPGENKITSDNPWVDIAVRFKPRYM